MVLWRVVIAALLPITQDEAYYADWARSLAWGYFDHPPGVALLSIGTWLAPGSALAARLGTLVAGLLTLIVMARFFHHCGLTRPSDLALALILLYATLPGFTGGVITTPDTGLALAWALALHESERALAGQRRRWLSAGLAVGFGLLGKYTMVLIAPVLLWALWRSDRRALRTPWPYLGALVALLVFAPNIIWNLQHDWLTMRFQLGHGFATDFGVPVSADPASAPRSDARTLTSRLGAVIGYLGTQIALWGLIALPLLVVLGERIGAPWRIRATRGPAPGLRLASEQRTVTATLIPQPHARPLLWAATLVPLGFFALVATIGEVEANWPAVYLLTAAALLTGPLRERRRWVVLAALGNLLLLTLYAVHAATAALPLSDHQNRVLRETHGFRELALLARDLDAPVHADRYQTTAMLRFYAPDLDTTQWPGLTRPSEYLRGRIAPRIDPREDATPFWLVTVAGNPPTITGFSSETSRTLFDCAGAPLSEGPVAPCARPLHVWHLHRYRPKRGVDTADGATPRHTIVQAPSAR
ncbi:glycosyltransferase family 39 protein [Thiocapsa imhoffii]